MKRALLILILLIVPVRSFALSPDELHRVLYGSVYYDNSTKKCAGGGAALSGDDNKAKIFNYLIAKGLADFQVAGIMGNMFNESSYEPRLVQYGELNTRGEISKIGDPSSLDDNVPMGEKTGYGIVQFTAANYKNDLVRISKEKGVIAGDLGLQLDYLWFTITDGYLKGFADQMKATTDVGAATTLFQTGYENPLRPDPNRVVQAQQILDEAHAGSIPAAAATTPTASSTTSGTSGKPTIVLDPGHSAIDNGSSLIDPATKLIDHDYPNPPEDQQVFDTATKVKAALEPLGYNVIMTKNAVTDSVYLRQRADIANNAHADLAVSIHDDPGQDPNTFHDVYTQAVGLYRGTEGQNKTVFNLPDVATKSQAYGQIFKTEREKVQGGTVNLTQGHDMNGRGLEPGNIPMVQLFSTVPWVYNETGANGGVDTDKYAESIVNSIKAAIPATPTGANCSQSANGNIMSTVINYAWPDDRGYDVTMKPEYADAVKKAQSEGRYVGGVQYPGVDCGGFVTTAMIDSGFEPNYNESGKGGATSVQLPWVQKNWQEIGAVTNSADLRPGDVAFLVTSAGVDAGHTYIWVGDQPNFHSNIASSALDKRAPMASKNYDRIGPTAYNGANIIWFRKK